MLPLVSGAAVGGHDVASPGAIGVLHATHGARDQWPGYVRGGLLLP